VLIRWGEDRVHLQPIDGRPPYPYRDDEQRKVARDAYVSWPGSRYSVPWFLLDVDLQSEPISLSFNVVQDQNVGVWDKGLRMARGSCHRLSSLNHSISLLF
jgi:hypothetical protein